MEQNKDALYYYPSLLECDPPDVAAENGEGNSVGSELTELVDQSAVDTALRSLSSAALSSISMT